MNISNRSGPDPLGTLADPREFTQPLELTHNGWERLKTDLRMMLLIRKVEETIGDGILSGTVRCPCHLGIGQEAIAVGIAEHLRKTDRVFGNHRSHSHFLATGGSVYGLLAEVLGKEGGCSRGMGGSMHLYGADHGFYGSVPIVGGTIPLAVGAALAAKRDRASDIAVAYFGDGATEEGLLHESLNLAAILKVPVLFVCENNLFSSHLHVSLRQPGDRMARHAAAHAIPAETVDGNDVLAVSAATSRLVAGLRSGKGPGFLEAVTYRWRGHVGPSEDNDVGVNRGTELGLWKMRDPISRLVDALKERGIMTADEYMSMDSEVAREVSDAWARAESSKYPPASNLLRCVYAEAN